jgi:hypothetical protein
MAGSFIWSLTFTDIFSQWTENRAVWNKGATDVLAQVKDLEQGLAFALEGFDVDNDSEFLTFHLWRYLWDRPRPVPMTRSRAYQRLVQAELIPLINEPVHGEFVIEAPRSGDLAPLPPSPMPRKLLAHEKRDCIARASAGRTGHSPANWRNPSRSR